ncbi:translation initiation factor eIF3 subunit [Lactarius hengduanensis]|nr:translation initiation factor eIF3 subunit [Lactarius hengduanensis]
MELTAFGSQSDWEASSKDDEVKAKPAATAAAPPKKKGTLKQKRGGRTAGGSNADYNEDVVFNPREKARLEKERELESNLHNTMELFGSSANADLNNILKSSPSSKEDFVALSEAIITHIVKHHQDKPLYSMFVKHHVRARAMPLRDVHIHKAASRLTMLANEKQQGEDKLDTTVYDEALDDFGSNTDDFM